MNGHPGQDMEGWTGIQWFGRFDKDRLAWNGVYPFKAGGNGQKGESATDGKDVEGEKEK